MIAATTRHVSGYALTGQAALRELAYLHRITHRTGYTLTRRTLQVLGGQIPLSF